MKTWGKEFQDFLFKQNFLALALAVVMGQAVSKVVEGVVQNLVMPIVGLLLPGGEWKTAQFVISGENAIKYGDMLGRLLDFAVIAAVVFWVTKVLIRPAPPAPAPATKSCPFCLETIPEAAKRCRACTSNL